MQAAECLVVRCITASVYVAVQIMHLQQSVVILIRHMFSTTVFGSFSG